MSKTPHLKSRRYHAVTIIVRAPAWVPAQDVRREVRARINESDGVGSFCEHPTKGVVPLEGRDVFVRKAVPACGVKVPR